MLTRFLLAFSLFFVALASPAAAQPIGNLPSATNVTPTTIVPCATAGVAGSTKGCTTFQVTHAGGGDCEIGNYCPVDPAATNYLFQSNTLTTSPWTTSNVTVAQSALAGTGSIGIAWDLTSTSTGGFIQQITPINSIPADTRTYVLSAYFDKTRTTTPWTISFFFTGGPSNTMVYVPGTDMITSCVGGGTCGRQFIGNKVRLYIAAPNASYTRATIKIYPTGTLGTTGISTVDNVQFEAATGATQLTAPTCINRTANTAIARTGVCGQSGASLTGDQSFSGVQTFTNNLLFTRYPLSGNPTMIFGGPTTAISPNNAFIELDCKVEVSNVCAIVPIQSNQFATGAARQPDLIGWRGSCAVDGTFVIADYSACIARTGDATLLFQASAADGYHQYSKSVTNAVNVAPGSGYTAGDVLTAVGGTVSTREGANSVPAAITVDTVSGGAVSTFHVSNIGAYVADIGFPLPVNPVSFTGGTGTGATFTLTFNNHANPTNLNIIGSVDSLCGSPSAFNIPGRIKLGVEDPYSGATFPTLAPNAMNYSIDIRCDNSVVFTGGPTNNGGSGGGLYWTPFGSNSRTRFMDLNTGLIDSTALVSAASGVKGAVTPDGNAAHYLNGAGAWTTPAGSGTGTVTSVAVTTANGVSGSVANSTTTPAISLTLGAITPSSVAASGTVTGSNLSGTNTGDQTTVSGSAGSVANAVTFDNSGSGAASGTTFNGSAARTISTNTIGALKASNNLSDVTASTARTNLGLGTAATQSTGTFLQTANNLSDVTATTARTNLGLGTAATQATSAFLQPSNNLSDVASINLAAKNLQAGYVIDQSAVAVSHTGDTTVTNLATVTVPAGAMGANGRLKISTRYSFTGSAGTKPLTITFGGTTIASVTPQTTHTNYVINLEIANRGSTGSQYVDYVYWSSAAANAPIIGTAAIDTTGAVTILITGKDSNAADTVTLDSYEVLAYPKS